MLNYGEHNKGEIEIKDPQLIFNNKFAEIYNDDVIFPSGDKGTYLRVKCKPSRSIAILPVTNTGNIIVIKNYRHGVRGWGIEIPKGAVEENESYLDAAARELEEETGYVFKNIVHLGEYSESPAILANKINCFIAIGCEGTSKRKPEKTEAISDVLEMSVEDFLLKKAKYDYVDALSEMLVYKYIVSKGDSTNE